MESSDENNFADRFLRAIDERQNPSCVGLDPRVWRIPESITEDTGCLPDAEAAAEAITAFNMGIIDAIYDIAPAVKLQRAFYERFGSAGIRAFERTVQHARSKDLIVIEDAKRSDIGSTAEAYADGHLGRPQLFDESHRVDLDQTADIMTVNPYLGSDTIEPFLDVCREEGTGIFVLCRTSNPSAVDLQDMEDSEGVPVYVKVAEEIDKWGRDLTGEEGYSSVGAVVGATYPREAETLRRVMPNTIFLIPGYGAQGGGAEGAVAGLDEEGRGGIVNSSRGINFAYQEDTYPNDYKKAAAEAALNMRREIREALQSADKWRW